eukprot:4865754-Karenia_brevis.AAC.1
MALIIQAQSSIIVALEAIDMCKELAGPADVVENLLITDKKTIWFADVKEALTALKSGLC